MPLGMEVGLGPGDFELDGDPAPPPQIFGPCLLSPNGRMDQVGASHGDRPKPRRLCVRWRPTPSPKGGGALSPIFGPFLLWRNGRMHQDATWYGGRPSQGNFVLDGNLAPPQKGGGAPNFRPMSIVAKRLDVWRRHLVRK